ncbi:MAG TPA: bifunctional methylenetetrahydrofolate dehydrogenase/methenyltetrahydrofolate cyclohydrolase FolD [Candidatus Marinimicrobia bacterium]|nr:bifunctional methylenetetrahydrofolate dehydrogenase/methenyltetrahydrofolate cyclohydrolase FolD [Candidatus Neomarinimicrobiota bacterium]
MSALILCGKTVSKNVKNNLKSEIAILKAKGIVPSLAVVLVGDNPASHVYVRNKQKAAEELGIYSVTMQYDASMSQDVLNRLIDELNADEHFHGILVQLPLPKHLNENEVIQRISPDKDVDGFHPVSVGKLVLGQDTFVSCTPAGVMEILKFYNIDPSGKNVVIIGRSNIVGKPMLNLLYQKATYANATVTICHTRTKDIAAHTKQADIVIVAAGRPHTLTADMVKEGVVVIDVGINRIEDPTTEKGYSLVGDADYEGLLSKVSAITPVPGGVGPMTIAMLMKNTVISAGRILSK